MWRSRAVIVNSQWFLHARFYVTTYYIMAIFDIQLHKILYNICTWFSIGSKILYYITGLLSANTKVNQVTRATVMLVTCKTVDFVLPTLWHGESSWWWRYLRCYISNLSPAYLVNNICNQHRYNSGYLEIRPKHSN